MLNENDLTRTVGLRGIVSRVRKVVRVVGTISQVGSLKTTTEETRMDEEGLKVDTEYGLTYADCGHVVHKSEEVSGRCSICGMVVCGQCFSDPARRSRPTVL